MKGLRCLVLATVVLMATFASLAEEENKFKDEAEIAFADKTGNTDTTDLNLKNLMTYRFSETIDGAWKLAIGYGQTGGDKTAENYATEVKINHAMSKRIYASVLTGWEQDKFSGFDYRYYIGPGLGYKFMTGPQHFLFGEAGLQYVMENYTDDTSDNFMEGRAFGSYKYQITEKSAFTQEIECLSDLETAKNYKINSNTYLTAALNSRLFLKTGYEIKYNNHPAEADIQKTDKILSASLGINF